MIEEGKLNRGVAWLGKACGSVSLVSAAALIVAITLLVTIDVIGRGIFGKSILIAVPTSGYALVAITFLGLAYTELRGSHVSTNILTRRIPPAKREPLEVFVLIMTLAFSIWFTWILFGQTKMNYHVTSIDCLHIRMWIPYSMAPIGVGMFAVVLLTKVIQKLRGLANPKDIK